jgi:hypothetical protein
VTPTFLAQEPLDKTQNSYFWSKEYLAKSAEDKLDDLWTNIMEDTTSGKFPSVVELPGIFLESMEPSFSGKGDAMPAGSLYGTRTKYIHSVGAVGKVKFVAKSTSPYTGIFKGADQGLIRLSSAAAPTADSKSPLAPGMGLKFLRDGIDSANLVSMWSVAGQPNDWNFFSNTFFNHIAGAPADRPDLGALSAKFATATDHIQQVGLSDFAMFDQSGAKVSKLAFPFALEFEASADVSNMFPTALPGTDPLVYSSQLETVPSGSSLYQVFAWDQPSQAGGKRSLIGELVLDGSMTKSKWGDEGLFFRHQKMDDDIKIYPQWEQYTRKYSTGGKCPFGY